MKKITQTKAAQVLGVTPQHLCSVLKKKVQPSPRLAMGIENVLGIPKEELRPDIWPAKVPADV